MSQNSAEKLSLVSSRRYSSAAELALGVSDHSKPAISITGCDDALTDSARAKAAIPITGHDEPSVAIPAAGAEEEARAAISITGSAGLSGCLLERGRSQSDDAQAGRKSLCQPYGEAIKVDLAQGRSRPHPPKVHLNERVWLVLVPGFKEHVVWWGSAGAGHGGTPQYGTQLVDPVMSLAQGTPTVFFGEAGIRGSHRQQIIQIVRGLEFLLGELEVALWFSFGERLSGHEEIADPEVVVELEPTSHGVPVNVKQNHFQMRLTAPLQEQIHASFPKRVEEHLVQRVNLSWVVDKEDQQDDDTVTGGDQSGFAGHLEGH